jgi:ParB-like chromosome segregation protein Spo0J
VERGLGAQKVKNVVVDGIAVRCSHDAIVNLRILKPHPANPNTHPDKQVKLLAKIIQRQGWRAPITVSNLSGFIVRGHARRLAARKLGLKKVPVDYQDYASETDELADLVADNKIAELSELDFTKTADLFAEQFNDGQFDTDLTAFDEEEIKGMMDYAPEIADIDELLEELDMGDAIDNPIWVVIRAGREKTDAIEKALSLLESEGIKFERSYGK